MTTEIRISNDDRLRAAEVYDYVNARASIASPEHRLQQVVRHVVRQGVDHLNGTHFTDDDERQSLAALWAVLDVASIVVPFNRDGLLGAIRVEAARERHHEEAAAQAQMEINR